MRDRFALLVAQASACGVMCREDTQNPQAKSVLLITFRE